MKIKNAAATAGLFGALFLCGCIHTEETVYNDVPRIRVEFDNDKAARVFYETLSRMKDQRRSESSVDVEIPLVFEHKHKVITGENTVFNDAVSRCDTNRDGRITEEEARIFSETVR